MNLITKKLSLVMILFLLFLFYGCNNSKEEASDKKKNYREADAQYKLGVCYEYGQGVEQSYSEAVKWYRKAAEQGQADAQFSLGVSYANGQGVEQSWEEAVKWYHRAVKQDHASAQYNLAYCYVKGTGVEPSMVEAVKLYHKAAEQGHIKSQNYLGLYYENGQGVKQSYAEAVKWYRKAAEQGHVTSQYNLARCYANGIGVKPSMVEALKWYRKAAEQGDTESQFNLGMSYVKGKGVEQSWEEATNWFRKAAEQGDVKAQTNLGWCYENGKGVEQSLSEALKWYQKATDQGDQKAQNALNIILQKIGSDSESIRTESIITKIKQYEPMLETMTKVVLENPRWKAKSDKFRYANKKAINNLLKAIKNTNSIEDRLGLGFTYGGQLDCKLALEQYFEVINKSPDIIDPFCHISQMIYNLMNLYQLAEIEADSPVSNETLFNGKDPVIEIGLLAKELLDYAHEKSIYPSEFTMKLLPEGGDIALKKQIVEFIVKRSVMKKMSPK